MTKVALKTKLRKKQNGVCAITAQELAKETRLLILTGWNQKQRRYLYGWEYQGTWSGCSHAKAFYLPGTHTGINRTEDPYWRQGTNQEINETPWITGYLLQNVGLMKWMLKQKNGLSYKQKRQRVSWGNRIGELKSISKRLIYTSCKNSFANKGTGCDNSCLFVSICRYNERPVMLHPSGHMLALINLRMNVTQRANPAEVIRHFEQFFTLWQIQWLRHGQFTGMFMMLRNWSWKIVWRVTKSRNTQGKLIECLWSETKPCHRHGAGIRKMIKHFLADFWYVWRNVRGVRYTLFISGSKVGTYWLL